MLLLWVSPAYGDDRDRDRVRDLVYEAADAIDAAELERREGNQRESDRLLSEAERFLDDAWRLAPGDATVSLQRSRLLRLDGDPETAEAELIGALVHKLDPTIHGRGVVLLDQIRLDRGRPPVGSTWRTGTSMQLAGAAALGGGLALAVGGFAGAFDATAKATYAQRDVIPAQTTAGWVLAGAGGGVGAFGGALLIGGQLQLDALRRVLPGPWRLPGGSLENGARLDRRRRDTLKNRRRM